MCVCDATEKYEQATILFSDIVTFTNIASAVQPMDIVNMLNSLYSRFDNLCTMHGVYKVKVTKSLIYSLRHTYHGKLVTSLE